MGSRYECNHPITYGKYTVVVQFRGGNPASVRLVTPSRQANFVRVVLGSERTTLSDPLGTTTFCGDRSLANLLRCTSLTSNLLGCTQHREWIHSEQLVRWYRVPRTMSLGRTTSSSHK